MRVSFYGLLASSMMWAGAVMAEPPASQPHSQPSHSQPHAHGGHAGHNHGGHAGHGMNHRFDDAEKWAKVFDDPKRDAWQKPEEIVKHLDLKHGYSVADIGAGTGYLLPHLARAVQVKGTVVALEIEDTLVAHMKQRVKKEGQPLISVLQVRKVPPNDPQLHPGRYHRAVVLDVWHHISDREAYSAKIASGLQSGGKLLVIDFTMDSPYGPPKAHRLPPEQIVKELEAGGLKASILEDETLPHQYIVVGEKP